MRKIRCDVCGEAIDNAIEGRSGIVSPDTSVSFLAETVAPPLFQVDLHIESGKDVCIDCLCNLTSMAVGSEKDRIQAARKREKDAKGGKEETTEEAAASNG